MASTRALLLVCLSLTTLACGGESSSSGAVDASTPPADVSAPSDVAAATDATDATASDSAAPADVTLPADVCTPYCARVVGAMGCMRDMPTCMRDCATQIAATPSVCRQTLDAWFACALSSTATCSGMVTRFAGCDDAQTALVICVAMPPDGGTDPCARKIDCAGCVANAACGWCNRHCLPGNAAGPTAPASCGGQPWVRAAAMCL